MASGGGWSSLNNVPGMSREEVQHLSFFKDAVVTM